MKISNIRPYFLGSVLLSAILLSFSLGCGKDSNSSNKPSLSQEALALQGWEQINKEIAPWNVEVRQAQIADFDSILATDLNSNTEQEYLKSNNPLDRMIALGIDNARREIQVKEVPPDLYSRVRAKCEQTKANRDEEEYKCDLRQPALFQGDAVYGLYIYKGEAALRRNPIINSWFKGQESTDFAYIYLINLKSAQATMSFSADQVVLLKPILLEALSHFKQHGAERMTVLLKKEGYGVFGKKNDPKSYFMFIYSDLFSTPSHRQLLSWEFENYLFSHHLVSKE